MAKGFSALSVNFFTKTPAGPLDPTSGGMKQAFIGKIIVPFIRKSIFSEKPFGKNSPTDPTFVVADERQLDAERDQLLKLIDRFVERGPDAAGKETHSFFGKLSGPEWGELMYKHIDHHLQQFGA